MRNRNAVRNCLIFAALEAGKTPEELADEFGITTERVRDIKRDEQHKRLWSLDAYYRQLRSLELAKGGGPK